MANSPELIVDSFKSMPFIKNDDARGAFGMSNFFLKGEGYYQKLEEGLWLIMSDFEPKRDLSFVMYYDEALPANYHVLTMYLNKGAKKIRLPKFQLDVECVDGGWMLLKANGKSKNSHFKGQKSVLLSIYFSQEWLENNLVLDNGQQSHLKQFLQAEDQYLYLPLVPSNKREVHAQIVAMFQERTEITPSGTLLFKSKTLDLLSGFLELIESDQYYFLDGMMNDHDRRKMLRVKHALDSAIFGKFPTIQKLSAIAGVSETKLKTDFKQLTGMTVYAYFSSAQMQHARDLMLKEKLNVKETASMMGYESQSKFAMAYKRFFGVSPSEEKIPE